MLPFVLSLVDHGLLSRFTLTCPLIQRVVRCTLTQSRTVVWWDIKENLEPATVRVHLQFGTVCSVHAQHAPVWATVEREARTVMLALFPHRQQTLPEILEVKHISALEYMLSTLRVRYQNPDGTNAVGDRY